MSGWSFLEGLYSLVVVFSVSAQDPPLKFQARDFRVLLSRQIQKILVACQNQNLIVRLERRDADLLNTEVD